MFLKTVLYPCQAPVSFSCFFLGFLVRHTILKRATCFAASLQSELISYVARVSLPANLTCLAANQAVVLAKICRRYLLVDVVLQQNRYILRDL